MKSLGFVFFLLTTSIHGHSSNQLFKKLEGFDELNPHKIINIKKDVEGFLWVATKNNLYRFDGLNFKRLNELIDLPSHLWVEINAIEMDSKNRIWILT